MLPPVLIRTNMQSIKKIIIDDDNVLFEHGLKHFLRDLFPCKNGKGFAISHELTKDNVAQADIVILKLKCGEAYLCHDALYERNDRCLVIGLFEDATPSMRSELPECLKGAVFVNRNIALTELEKNILEYNDIFKKKYHDGINCKNCSAKTLKGSQLEVARRIFNKESIADIASAMGLNDKTIYAHKLNLMATFGLRNTCELRIFLEHYHSKYGL